jgi:hypothetical protein
MSNSYTYITTVGGKSSQVLFYTGVAPSKSPKAVPVPKSGTQPNAIGAAMEAWADLKKPSGDTVEGGLYSKSGWIATYSKAHISIILC